MIEVIGHHFAGGVYAKAMRIPEDFEVVSHKHNYDHLSILAEGCVIVEVDGKQETYWSPAVIEIKAGAEHSVTPVNGPALWYCVHSTDCADPEKVDQVLIKLKPHMRKLPFVASVCELNEQILDHPHLWDRFDLRTRAEDSPHREVSDIWIKYRRQSEFDETQPEKFADMHQQIWYEAYYFLPAIKPIIRQLRAELGEFDLGGVLITKIPPGKQVYPHSDAGQWHPEYFDTKVLVLLSSAPGQRFCYENEMHEGNAGDVFEFDNRPVHWVVNDSDVDRVSLIFAIRKPR